MNATNKYKWELVPYFNCKGEERSGLSANHLYGKFLNYTEEQDFIGANLAKNMLKRGQDKNDEFKPRYVNACNNESFLSLKDEFYNSTK
tara:strand:- start:96 stop:362 length:267 start_codon:yes stop_codon:yes gene_type:complete